MSKRYERGGKGNELGETVQRGRLDFGDEVPVRLCLLHTRYCKLLFNLSSPSRVRRVQLEGGKETRTYRLIVGSFGSVEVGWDRTTVLKVFEVNVGHGVSGGGRAGGEGLS